MKQCFSASLVTKCFQSMKKICFYFERNMSVEWQNNSKGKQTKSITRFHPTTSFWILYINKNAGTREKITVVMAPIRLRVSALRLTARLPAWHRLPVRDLTWIKGPTLTNVGYIQTLITLTHQSVNLVLTCTSALQPVLVCITHKPSLDSLFGVGLISFKFCLMFSKLSLTLYINIFFSFKVL